MWCPKFKVDNKNNLLGKAEINLMGSTEHKINSEACKARERKKSTIEGQIMAIEID